MADANACLRANMGAIKTVHVNARLRVYMDVMMRTVHAYARKPVLMIVITTDHARMTQMLAQATEFNALVITYRPAWLGNGLPLRHAS